MSLIAGPCRILVLFIQKCVDNDDERSDDEASTLKMTRKKFNGDILTRCQRQVPKAAMRKNIIVVGIYSYKINLKLYIYITDKESNQTKYNSTTL